MKTQMLRVLKASTMVGLAAVLVMSLNSVAHARGQSDLATAGQTTSSAVPRLVKFNGTIKDEHSRPQSGVVGITFALYKDQQGRAPLWLETQNVVVGQDGHYSVQLGSTKPEGLPAELFTSGEARWVGVQPQGQAEQPRVLLLSVPYALKAQDAETLGGKPASAFLAATGNNSLSSGSGLNNALSGGGKTNYVPLWLSPTKLGSSNLFQAKGGKVGVGTTSPAANLDVNGTSNIRNTLTLFPNGNSPTLSINGTTFGISNTGLISFVNGQTFAGTGTVTSVASGPGLSGGPITHSGTLSIANGGVTNTMLQNSSLTITASSPLTGGGAVSLGGSTSLGLTSSCSNGQILKWNGSAWACAADNNSGGTVTSVGSGLGLTGGPITGSGTLSIDTTAVPQLNAANSFTGSQSVTGNISATGTVTGGAFYGAGSGLNNVNAAMLSGYSIDHFPFVDTANTFTKNQTISVGVNAQPAVIGDMGCYTGAGISVGDPAGCTNYALMGYSSDTLLNRPLGGTIRFREGNGANTGYSDQMAIAPGGDVVIGVGVGNDGGGFKHARAVTIVSPQTEETRFRISWPTPFADSGYTVTVSLEEDNSPDGYGWVTAVEMKDKTPDSVGVILYNTDTVDHAVIVHAIAVHD